MLKDGQKWTLALLCLLGSWGLLNHSAAAQAETDTEMDSNVLVAPPPSSASPPALFALPRPSSRPCPSKPNPLEPCTDAQEIERGKASWYGPGFHGKRTANGERFDMYGLTAAHKTLPFGTHIRVRSLRNGHEVDVRVNDRGPFARGKMIDLSRAAAEAIGLVDLGVKDVMILIVNPVEAASTQALSAQPHTVVNRSQRPLTYPKATGKVAVKFNKRR